MLGEGAGVQGPPQEGTWLKFVTEHWDNWVCFPAPEPPMAKCSCPLTRAGLGSAGSPSPHAALPVCSHTGSWCDWLLRPGPAVAAFRPPSTTAAGSAQVGDGRGPLGVHPSTSTGSGHPLEPPLPGCSGLCPLQEAVSGATPEGDTSQVPPRVAGSQSIPRDAL